MKKLLPILIFTIMMAASYHLNAATIDFAAVADGTDTSYGFTGEFGASSMYFGSSLNPGLTVSGTVLLNDRDPVDAFAYLDKGNAGLGVCQVITDQGQCSPSSDDNVTYRELLTLDFDAEVSLNDVTFVNGSHGTAFTGDFGLFVDGVDVGTYDLANIFAVDLSGTSFSFYNPNAAGHSGASNGDQFYINQISFNDRSISAVPVPTAAWLFGSGLLGLVGVARRNT